MSTRKGGSASQDEGAVLNENVRFCPRCIIRFFWGKPHSPKHLIPYVSHLGVLVLRASSSARQSKAAFGTSERFQNQGRVFYPQGTIL